MIKKLYLFQNKNIRLIYMAKAAFRSFFDVNSSNIELNLKDGRTYLHGKFDDFDSLFFQKKNIRLEEKKKFKMGDDEYEITSCGKNSGGQMEYSIGYKKKDT